MDNFFLLSVGSLEIVPLIVTDSVADGVYCYSNIWIERMWVGDAIFSRILCVGMPHLDIGEY